jgi:hypothetical protein
MNETSLDGERVLVAGGAEVVGLTTQGAFSP